MKSGFADLVETTSMRVQVEVYLLNAWQGTLMCQVSYSESNDAFSYAWVGTLCYRNPVYAAEFITRTLMKAMSDSSEVPSTHLSRLSFRIRVLQWYPTLDQLAIVKQHEVGFKKFTCSAAATYREESLFHATDQGGPGRVFIQGTKWPVVVTKNKVTESCLRFCAAAWNNKKLS